MAHVTRLPEIESSPVNESSSGLNCRRHAPTHGKMTPVDAVGTSTAHHAARITKECLVGGPVTAVAFLSATECLYGIGPYLHRVPWVAPRVVHPDANETGRHETDRLLVFPEGGTIHGIRLYRHAPNETNPSPRPLVALWGGRRMAFLTLHPSCHGGTNGSVGSASMELVDLALTSTVPVGATTHHQTDSGTARHCLEWNDWIWDCTFWSSPNQCRLVVGLAHNRVHVYDLYDSNDLASSTSPAHTVFLAPTAACASQQGTTRCLTYCMNLWCAHETSSHTEISTIAPRVAVGTTTNTIHIWCLDGATPTRDGDIPSHPEHVLTGHEGVIHAVQFHPCGQRLVSTSDDRTVRLWSQWSEDDASQGWTLLWTAFGHSARGWHVAFAHGRSTGSSSSSSTASLHDHAEWVVSTGEDGTLRVWAMASGQALAVARGHACQSVWRVDTLCAPATFSAEEVPKLSGWAVSGGNDGTVAVYNLLDRLPRDVGQEMTHGGQQGDHVPLRSTQGTWQNIWTVPDDRVLPLRMESNTEEANIELPHPHGSVRQIQELPKPKKAKMIQQTIVGMKFSSLMSTVVKTAGPSLVVATRTGSVWCLDSHTGQWVATNPWSNQAEHLDADGTTGGCCMCLHATRPLIAVGTLQGDVVLSTLQPRNDPAIQSTHPHVMTTTRQYRSVQKLEWVRPDTLVSFQVQALVWRVFSSLTSFDSSSAPSYEHTTAILVTGVKGLAICCAINQSNSLLVVGDTRGNVVLFDLLACRQDSGSEVAPTAVLRNVHQKEHVTALVWKTDQSVLSVGNDGHVSELSVDSFGRLIKLLSVPVGAFTGISYVWSLRCAPMAPGNRTVVGGYYGNRFAIVDVSSGYEFFSVETGGRQRAIDVFPGVDPNFAEMLVVAICQTRKDGRNDIVLCGHGPSDRAVESQALTRYSTGVSLHGESVFDVNLFPLDATGRSVAVLTASEDCSAKIALFQDGVVTISKPLPPQVSGIRAVCSCRLDGETTVVVIGEKSGVKLFLVSDLEAQAKYPDIRVRFLGSGTQQDKPSIDHRINCVGCVVLSADDDTVTGGNEILVVSGDSNGNCYLYRFSQLSQYETSYTQLLYQDERPILSLSLVHVAHRYLLLLGGTGGSVAMFELPDTTKANAWENLSLSPFLCYSAHSMGTNAIASCVVAPSVDLPPDSVQLRVCSGGDDQAICCCDIILSTSTERLGAFIHHLHCAKEAAMSAIKGVAFVDPDGTYIAVTGYDQRLALWQWHDSDNGDALTWLTDAAVDIGDINCLAIHRYTVGQGEAFQAIVAVGGAGIELLSIDL